LYICIINKNNLKMKKVLFVFAVLLTVGLAACGGGVSNNPTTDSTAVDSAKVDTTAAVVAVDSAKVDSAK
jgi:ABC-type glycerol-3-phosphate transport system substrate-binding protein